MATEPLEEALLHIATNPVLAQRGAQPIGETAPTGIDSAVLEQAKGIFESLDSKGKDELRQEQERILTRKSSIQPKPQLVSEEEPEPVERLAMPARGSRPDLRDSVDAAALEALVASETAAEKTTASTVPKKSRKFKLSMLLKRITGKNGGKSAPAPKVAKGAQRKAAPKVDFKGEDLGMRERVDKIYQAVESSEKGLSTQEANRRLQEYGPNALQSEETSKLLRVMEVAAILAAILGDWADFGLILGLLLFNASLGFYEENSSGDAIKALQKQLTPTCKALRDGSVSRVESVDLVPGDVILVRLGDIVPADSVILPGSGTLKVDQSSLTGESLPVNKDAGADIFSGSIIKQGEVYAVVIATGPDTYFGKAARLIEEDEAESHVFRVLRCIGYFCICMILVGASTAIIVDFVGRQQICDRVTRCPTLLNSLVIIVGGVPIAMPTVLSVTMAIGAFQLAKKNAIVARLTAVEELAGMDVLCSDKTGTLTKNKLTLAPPIPYVEHVPIEDVILIAALASSRETEDAIDIAMIDAVPPEVRPRYERYQRIGYQPFDPVSKRTTAQMRDKSTESIIWAEKGAPQVVLLDSSNQNEISDRVNQDINELAGRGYRSLGVAQSDDGTRWDMVGLIPMFDPPRDDTKETIEKIKSLGISIKMITGDQVAIAKETSRLIGLGDNIKSAKATGEGGFTEQDTMKSDGYAQVFPEHKFAIVKALLDGHHTVGMTGDGVNDAPALKKASIGIAVEGATDAARSAADIVLVSPGLSVIYDATLGARKIFQRMKNYSMYSITTTVRFVMTFTILTVAFGWYFSPIAVVFLAILNDLSMIAVSRDRVKPSPTPDTWDLFEIFLTAIALGTWLSASTITLWVITIYTTFWTNFGLPQLDGVNIRGLIYYQVSISGLATIFVTRARGFSWQEIPGFWVVVAFIGSQTINMVFGAVGLGCYPCDGFVDWRGSGWGYVLAAWVWSIAWFWPMDFIKFFTRWFAHEVAKLELTWDNIPERFTALLRAHGLLPQAKEKPSTAALAPEIPPPIIRQASKDGTERRMSVIRARPVSRKSSIDVVRERVGQLKEEAPAEKKQA